MHLTSRQQWQDEIYIYEKICSKRYGRLARNVSEHFHCRAVKLLGDKHWHIIKNFWCVGSRDAVPVRILMSSARALVQLLHLLPLWPRLRPAPFSRFPSRLHMHPLLPSTSPGRGRRRMHTSTSTRRPPTGRASLAACPWALASPQLRRWHGSGRPPCRRRRRARRWRRARRARWTASKSSASGRAVLAEPSGPRHRARPALADEMMMNKAATPAVSLAPLGACTRDGSAAAAPK